MHRSLGEHHFMLEWIIQPSKKSPIRRWRAQHALRKHLLTRNSTQHQVKITANYSEGFSGCIAQRKGQKMLVPVVILPLLQVNFALSVSLDSVCEPCGRLRAYLHMYVLSRRIARSQLPVLQRVTYRVGGFSARTESLPLGGGSAQWRLGLGLRKEPTPQFPARRPWVAVKGMAGLGRCCYCAGETTFAALQQDEVEAQSECKEESVQSRQCREPPSLAWL